MKIKTIIEEDFVNYKVPVMYIGTAQCDGKCCIEAKIPLSVCQNNGWRKNPTINIDDDIIIKRYLNNNITKAICFAGLEPFEQFDELYSFIEKIREEYNKEDAIVIYTGYNKEEISEQINALKQFNNIIVKFGRYVPDQKRHFDKTLGVMLASDNQYAEKIS